MVGGLRGPLEIIGKKSSFTQPILWDLEMVLWLCIWTHLLTVSHSLGLVKRCHIWCELMHVSFWFQMAKWDSGTNVTAGKGKLKRYLESFVLAYTSRSFSSHPGFHWKEREACICLEVTAWSGWTSTWMNSGHQYCVEPCGALISAAKQNLWVCKWDTDLYLCRVSGWDSFTHLEKKN